MNFANWKAIYVIAFVILYWPVPTLKENYLSTKLLEKTKYETGSLITSKSSKDLYLRNKQFSRISDVQYAILGLNQPEKTLVLQLDWKNIIYYKLSALMTPELLISYQYIENDKPAFQTNKLRLPSNVWEKVNKDREKLQEEKKEAYESMLSHQKYPNFQCWNQPVKNVTVSSFASPRTLPNGKSYHHTGLDIRARKGTPIYAAADGKVVFQDKLTVPGNMIIISHGGDIFSRYMHLNKFKTEIGELVKKGRWIANAGSTGRVEAAHLHWEIIWKGNYGSPRLFLEGWEQICDPK